MNNKDFNQETKRKDRHGINNPMFGRTHSPQSREKMSQAATLRNQQYKQWNKQKTSAKDHQELVKTTPCGDVNKVMRLEESKARQQRKGIKNIKN